MVCLLFRKLFPHLKKKKLVLGVKVLTIYRPRMEADIRRFCYLVSAAVGTVSSSKRRANVIV